MKRLIASILSGLALSTSVMAADVVNESVLEKYAKHAQFMNIKISPEGKYLAATSRTPDAAASQ